MIYVDANVPTYLVGRPHPHKLDAQMAVERLAAERRRLVTSSEVHQELMHRYASAGRLDWIPVAFEALRAIVDEVFAVEEGDVLLAKDILLSHPKLTARDAVHAALMRRRDIGEILSFDGGFDEIPGIKRLPQVSAR